MKINEDNFVEQLKFRNEKALEYVIDNYGRIVKIYCKEALVFIAGLPGGMYQ